MSKEDIAQVNEIDREAFPTQWPPPNYRHELQNQFAHYVVAIDETKFVEEPKARQTFLTRLKQWFSHQRPPEKSSPPERLIVGFAGIWILADEAHITNIAVRKSYQRRGIGELLLIALIDLAEKLKADILTLEVRVSNTVAQNLYRKHGFSQVGLRRAYYTDNREDALLMSTENIKTDSFQERLRELKEAFAKRWGLEAKPPAMNRQAQPGKR